MKGEKKYNILIIEDNPEELCPLTRLLNNHGFRISQATSARVGFQRSQALRPDIILLDLYMPDLDGFTVCRLLSESPLTKYIPVIFLSSSTSVEDRLRGFDLGAMDFICKPYSAEEVLARIFVNIRRMKETEEKNDSGQDESPVLQDDIMLNAAIKLLKDNLACPPTVATLARSVGTHEKRLLKIFRSHLGTTVTSFIRQARLEKARELLCTDIISIEEIAAQVGFSSSANFSTAFRKSEGISPREYRKRRMQHHTPRIYKEHNT